MKNQPPAHMTFKEVMVHANFLGLEQGLHHTKRITDRSFTQQIGLHPTYIGQALQEHLV